MHSPAASVRAALPLSAEPGLPPYIGRYRILRRHGEGGMGTVYEAEQDNPRRTVALKVIRPGLVSAEHLNRFSHEAQILGRLQHSGIAQVYEAGRGIDGRPFFAMEFIRGMPLDEYARSHNLDLPARLELLAKVCDAVQHAHDKGVVHRDLKPGNILVEESGQPKVLDFGVAHVTAADVLTTSSQTQTGQLLGTLNYMSPEQLTARPSGLDGRSDVYTLGVILFELLAHRLPYHLDQLPVHEVARVIEQQEPSRLGSIDKLYRGDVAIIVAKAFEKDKRQRYASAGDLASDIRRYLNGEAILAREVSPRNDTGDGLAAIPSSPRSAAFSSACWSSPRSGRSWRLAVSQVWPSVNATRLAASDRHVWMPTWLATRLRPRTRPPRPRLTAPFSVRSKLCGPDISLAGVRKPSPVSPDL